MRTPPSLCLYFNDEENKFLFEIAEDESLAIKIIGDLNFYGAKILEKLIDILTKGYVDKLIREWREDCLLDRQRLTSSSQTSTTATCAWGRARATTRRRRVRRSRG
jgi:hypothetical protein